MVNWTVVLIVFPIVCGVIGYITNVLAVKMIFRPYNRISFLGLGFQGVLPKHQEHFARMLAQIITRDFVTTGDLVDELANAQALEAFENSSKGLVKDVVAELKPDLTPAHQAFLSDATVDALVGQVAHVLREEVPAFVGKLHEEAERSLDLEGMVAEKLIEIGAKGLEHVIYEISRRELVFIELYGAVFGALLGIFQVLILWVLGDIALPIVGVLVGTVTNWLAIQMLFHPREMTTYLGFFRYQGMFPRRQNEIATTLGSVAARDFIVPAEIFEDLALKLVPESLDDSRLESSEAWLRNRIPPLAQALDAMLSDEDRSEVMGHIKRRYPDLSKNAIDRLLHVAAHEVRGDNMLATRVQALEKTGFENLIRGLFEREEIYLIIYGGLLGGVMGFIQLLIVMATR